MNIARDSSAREMTWKPPVSTDAVKAKTGRGWEEWLSILDQEQGPALGHTAMAELLYEKYSVSGWWAQMVTVGYEQARGLRKVYEKADGFSASASRTVAIPLEKLYAAWSDARQRARWLPDAPIEIRRSTDGKSMRMTWTTGGSSIDVGFSAKGADKSRVAVEHAKLASAQAVSRQKAYWGNALDRLKELLEGSRQG